MQRESGVHVVVGAGPIGSGIARLLAGQGHQVKIVTRSGSGPAAHEGIERIAADAADSQAVTKLTHGAAALYNCANPPYHRWPELWPPLAAALLHAAEASGPVLVTISNLYGYGPAQVSIGRPGYDEAHPMTEQTPLAAIGKKGQVRAKMWHDALAAHEAGRIRATEVRASDYVGAGANAVLGDRVVPRLLRGQAVTLLGRTDRPHTWSYTGDVAALAVKVAVEERAWGRAWHAPSSPPRTQRQAVDDLARVAGVGQVPVRTVPKAMLRGIGAFSPLMRELRETQYQFSEDFVMDSRPAQREFGLDPTGWDDVLTEVLKSFSPS
jgi:nucleoside-diphosphate-sugar epimerase